MRQAEPIAASARRVGALELVGGLPCRIRASTGAPARAALASGVAAITLRTGGAG